jgi:2-polyprenyl-3-methyl-5-hydroxy-6-metoxy-1,4-benzoquinol methylase
MTTDNATAAANPALIFETLNAFQRTMALKGAVDLDLFTEIGAGAATAADLAARLNASGRGVRVLCDFLAIMGLLTKRDNTYALTPDSAAFLNRRSPAYLGSMANFLAHQEQLANFSDVAAVVRKGGTVRGDQGHMMPDNPIWVEFARSMAPMAALSARVMAPIVAEPGRPMKVLDIAAGHGLYGISVAVQNPKAEVVAVDWGNVLAVAIENARGAGVADRFRTIPGSAFEVDFGAGYDLVLLPNFLHHFNPETNVKLLKKIRAAMKPEGRVVTVDFIPNEDRVTPETCAEFSFIMLAATESGDAYTFVEFDRMFRQAGFGESRMQDLEPSPQRLIVTQRE